MRGDEYPAEPRARPERLAHAIAAADACMRHLVSERAEQLLREKITDSDRKRLFRESLSEVEETSK